jgi:hypothetical protein
MIRVPPFFLLIAFTILTLSVSAQIRLDRLELKPRQEYKILGSDILVVDTLIMRDSSRIILNKDKKENIINAKILIVGKGCMIIGRGVNGEAGKQGTPGIRQSAPCRNGGDGMEGSNGSLGTDGLNLSLYANNMKITGSLIIDLNGGDGGRGGNGGKGGDGGSGTRVCRGGNGGKGGDGGKGNNGLNGGSLLINCKACFDLHQIQGEKLIIRNYGGYAGLGGVGGLGGQAGLGPLQDGRNGVRGLQGYDGKAGKLGTIKFEK